MSTRARRISITLGLLLAVAIAFAWLRPAPEHEPETRAEPLSAARLDELEALGYVDWSEAEVRPGEVGVVRFDRERAHPGYNLIAARTQREARLLDMEGRVVHTWSYAGSPGQHPWEGVFMRPNGELLVLVKFTEVLRLGWDSELAWKLPLAAHHDITETPGGHFLTWVRDVRPFKGLLVRFPYLAEISAEGTLVSKWSTRNHLDAIKAVFDQRSFLESHLLRHYLRAVARIPLRWWHGTLAASSVRYFDYFHPNTANFIGPNENGARPEFAEGNLLIGLRNVNQIATLDPETKEILWAWGEGELDWPHHPTMLANGHILIFDNGTHRGHSRVVEFDPASGAIVWQYPEDPEDPAQHFYCAMKGSAQRLPNGNTLIGDGENGRAFEVTREGELVWEFLNPEIRDDKRATIYRVIRYPAEVVEPLLEGGPRPQPDR